MLRLRHCQGLRSRAGPNHTQVRSLCAQEADTLPQPITGHLSSLLPSLLVCLCCACDADALLIVFSHPRSLSLSLPRFRCHVFVYLPKLELHVLVQAALQTGGDSRAAYPVRGVRLVSPLSASRQAGLRAGGRFVGARVCPDAGATAHVLLRRQLSIICVRVRVFVLPVFFFTRWWWPFLSSSGERRRPVCLPHHHHHRHHLDLFRVSAHASLRPPR